MQNVYDVVISKLEREHAEILRLLKEIRNGNGKPPADIGITDAIRRAIEERPRTSIEVGDAVKRVLPNVERNTISAIICQRMSAGEFAKGDDLKLRIVRKVQS